ncbi:M20/M25/M40 family metallo-hydrolase [Oscillibacter sp. MSJ-2]|uniref:M20/M25/M40 family metallo-hydrolase n=1 Tax=Dysosmobacter acutus TaxID=2841504 RepID=A0ABS6F9Y9_9FIRM|nr:M20/M25/M40 family metallo-hydrolase [Dysosmobacter acutus]MBU5627111.1 M20/M25/M40 family metallo-hydrolase [Dysosmobacter acutus]
MNQDYTAYRTYLKQHWDEDISRIQEFLRQPCIPSNNIGCTESAQLLMRYYRELGCQEVELVETESGRPGVFAYLDCGAEKTLVNYCMLDTKPADGEGWSSNPFAADLVDREDVGAVILARGAQGRKGPYISWINALRALKEVDGKLPVNILFLAESEENCGSPNYKAFVKKYEDRIAKADAAFCPGAVQSRDGQVKLTLGYKGLINIRFTCSGLLWGKGPQKRATHAAAQALIESPTWRLIEALSTFRDHETGRLLIRDFYIDEPPVTDEERSVAEYVCNQFPGKSWKQFLPMIGTDVKGESDLLSNVDACLKFWYSPSFNINGLASGFTGPGTEVFRLPNQAWALCDVRVPRGYSAQKTIARIRQHLIDRGYEDISMEVIAAYEPCQTSPDSDLCSAVTGILDEEHIPWFTWPFVGGGGPWSLFSEYGLPTLFDVGLGYGGNAGGIDEFLSVESSGACAGIIDSELFFIKFLKRFADSNR